MSLGNVGSHNAFIQEAGTVQAKEISGKPGVEKKEIDQQTSKVSLQIFQSLSPGLEDLKNKQVVLYGGTSPADAPCQHLKNATKKFVAAEQVFQPIASQDNRLQEMLSAVTSGIRSGKVSEGDASVILTFGKHQLALYQNWEGGVKSFLSESEARLSTAPEGQKPFIQSGIQQAKDTLSYIKEQTKSLSEKTGDLEKTISSKFGKLTNATTPSLPSNNGAPQVYQLTRIR